MENRKYIGLEDARAEMPVYDRHNGFYVEIHYDLDTDEVYATPHVDFGMWSHTRYENPVSVPLRGLWFEILVLGSLISCGFAVRFAARICFLPIFYVA